ncbi:dUTP diphosphatase [Neobacillus massiliamazoniensis]|uniref:dUTPase n=1 Tax=Neobacillus massiliamazoniensis TaxID=1499688 RepID=A0A0U1NQK6_9BACI|nr:dUTP diphosphatase [Neobacillus massiliamazoniensis]CRK80330.1 dUTPase [Neobacillus massiliamazoniensis]
MNLKKMLSMQKVLDARIIKAKGLEGQDLFPNTILALIVELSEFANEGRWFKHWSKDQEPRTNVQCDYTLDDEPIYRNLVLEEFVDGVHFFLSLAIQKGWEEALNIFEEQLDPDYFEGNLTAWFLEMVHFLNKAYMEKYSDKDMFAGYQRNAYFFRIAWILFLNLGINCFGFTIEQIEQAYCDKNAVNHERQNGGY